VRFPGVYAERGVFVCFEGGEGSGKSTQSRLLRDALAAEGYAVLLTFEPGDTLVGREVRRIVLSPETGELAHKTEALLYAADKAEHVETVVLPALARGEVVITDRYVDSMLAYQGAGRVLAPAELEQVARWATQDLRPDVTVLLDVDPREAVQVKAELDRVEAAGLTFHERARAHFLELAGRDPGRYLVLAARRGREELAEEIWGRVEPLLSARSGRLEP
jgi:dTMP kinase